MENRDGQDDDSMSWWALVDYPGGRLVVDLLGLISGFAFGAWLFFDFLGELIAPEKAGGRLKKQPPCGI